MNRLSFIDDLDYGSPVRLGHGASSIGDVCSRWSGRVGMVVPTLDSQPHKLHPDKACKYVQEHDGVNSCLACPYRECLDVAREQNPGKPFKSLVKMVGRYEP